MDSISTARDFFINQQGLSPDQADMIVSKGMEAYNQQSQPQQNMMQMASGGIARLGYQMGGSPMGVGTMPMDYGQSLQVPQQMPTNFSSAQSITSNPLLNYGQPQLGTAGGTPLSMNRGGIARLGYQMGGEAMMQPQGMQQEQGMGQLGEGDNALLTIIQLLIEQGVDPEIAEKLARQILQIFAQGGEPALDQFINQLEQQEMSQDRTMMAGGGLTSIDRARDMLQSRAPNGEFLAYINPQEAGILRLMGGAGEDVNVKGVPSFFIKSIGKAIGSVAKGVTSAVKSVVKSPIGKLALTAAAVYAGGGGSFFGYTPFAGATPGFAFSNLPGASYFPSVFGTPADELGYGGIKGFLPSLASGDFAGAGRLAMEGVTGLAKNIGIGNLISAGTGFFGGTLAGGVPQQQEGESTPDFQKRVTQYNAQYAPLLNPTVQYPNNPFYPQTQMAADGGRIGYQEGGIGDLVKQVTQQEFFGTPMMAMGGRMGYAMGAEIPTRENQAGVKELDYRDTGGFVPPIGIKERADDIPAMLSNNEFVFTADAVRNAGGGDENLGAKRMYTLMKQLESGGSV